MPSDEHSLTKAAMYIRRNLQHMLLFSLILVPILVIYGNDFQIIANEALNNEAFSHVLLLPFLVGFLFYLKKDAVRAAIALKKRNKSHKRFDALMGTVLCLIAFLLYWYGSNTFYPLEYHLLSLPIFIMGLTLIFFNFKSFLVLLFPILFLLFLVPLPSTITYTVGGVFANVNTQAAFAVVKTAGLPVNLSSSYGAPTILLLTSTGQPALFSVDIPCSGIYSFIAFAMISSFLALIAQASKKKKLLMFGLGFVVFAILNIIRIIGILFIGYWFGEGSAMVAHSFAGIVLIFFGMLIILGLSDKVLKFPIQIRLAQQPPCSECVSSPVSLDDFCHKCGRFLNKSLLPTIRKSIFSKTLLVILACSVAVLSIRAPTFATAQNSIELSSNDASENATKALPELPGYTLVFLYRDVNFEKISNQDDSLVYGYFPKNTSDSIVYVAVGVSKSISNLHSWEVCFVTWQAAQGRYPTVNVLDSSDIQLLHDPPLVARNFVFVSPDNYTQVTLYWYERATFKTGLSVEQKYVRISLIILTEGSISNYAAYEKQLYTIGQEIASWWEPLKTQALVSFGVPTIQFLLVSFSIFLATTKTLQYFAGRRKKSINAKAFEMSASSEEKLVLSSIAELSKEKKLSTSKDVAERVATKIEKPFSLNTFMEILNNLEEHGFIRAKIINRENTPRLVWVV